MKTKIRARNCEVARDYGQSHEPKKKTCFSRKIYYDFDIMRHICLPRSIGLRYIALLHILLQTHQLRKQREQGKQLRGHAIEYNSVHSRKYSHYD